MIRQLVTWALVLAWTGSAAREAAGEALPVARDAPPAKGGAAAATAPSSIHALSPGFQRWQEALHALATEAGARTDPASFCASADALRPLHFRAHRERQALLGALKSAAWLTVPSTSAGPAGAPAQPWPWSGDTPPAAALSTLDTLDTAVVVDDGRIVFTNLNGALEVDPFEASRAFYQAFDDEYDFLLLFTNFPSQLVSGRFLAYHLAVANDVEGLGYRHVRPSDVFDDGPDFTGSVDPGRLQSVLHLNDLQRYPNDAQTIYWRDYTAPAFMAHELAHRWGARLRLCPSMGTPTALLGRSQVHWSFFFDSRSSILEGNGWETVTPYQISQMPTGVFGPLDLYLMGMLDPSDVGILKLLFQPVDCSPSVDARGYPWAAASAPQADVRCNDNTTQYFDLSCIVDANGPRLPAYPDTQQRFRVATLLVTRPGTPVQQVELEKLQLLREGLGEFFRAQTLGRGSLDFELRAVPARLHFAHRTQGDVEDPSQPIPIATGIVLEPRSLPTTLDDVQVSLFYSVDGAEFVELPLQRELDAEWSGAIPPQPLDSEIRYYLQATTQLSEHVWRLPEQAPASPFAFRVAPDTSPPSIAHVRLRTHGRNTEAALFRAVVLDEHAVADVILEYGVTGQPPQQQHLLPLGTTDVYETRLVPPGQVGDIVQYRIVARDGAQTPHVVASPPVGTHALEITRPQILDAESEDPLWSHRSLRFDGPDEWHREHISFRGNWSWKLGPDNISTNPRVGQMSLEQDAVLESPAVRLQEGWELRFYHRHYFRVDSPEGDGSGVDGGIVQIQDVENSRDVQDDRWWLVEPQAGYPMYLGGAAVFNPLRGYPCWSGDRDAWILERFSGALNPGLEGKLVRFRFRVAAGIPIGLTAPGAGWYLDDIEIDPGIAVAVTLQELHANSEDGAVLVVWRAAELEPGDVFHLSRADLDAGVLGRFAPLTTLEAIPGQEEYTYRDANVRAGRAYAYRVTLVRGARARSLETRVETAPLRFALHRARPNPFNPATEIAFDLPAPGAVTLTLYDVSGKRVRRLLASPFASGTHRTTWNGTDEAGRLVASGVYLCVLQSGGQRATQRLLLLR